jgi:hypothetical protein
LLWPLLLVTFFVVIYVVRIHEEMVDFEVYLRAAGRAVNAEPLYRPDDGHYQYKYFPAFAFAVYPFTRVPEPAARALWYAFSCGLLIMLVRWSVRALPERRLTERALIWCAVLFLGKFYARELNLGQTNLLLGALLVGALMAAQVDARRTAGVLVGLGVFVKVYAVALLPWVFLAGGVAGLASAGIVIMLGLAVPALVYGWQGNLDQIAGWYRTVTDTSAPNLLVPENVSFATLWAKWLEPGPLASQLAIATSVVALAVAAVVFLLRRRAPNPLYLEFGLLMLLVPVLSPQGWDYVLLLATPATIIIADRWRELPRAWQALTVLGIFFMSFTIFDLLGRTIYGLPVPRARPPAVG